MHHELKAGKIVFLAHLLRQLQEPHEHGGHGEEMGDAIAFDVAQQTFRIETRRDDDIGAKAEEVRPPGIGRAVIEGACGIRDDGFRIAPIRTEQRCNHRLGCDRLFRRGRQAAHALGLSRGAGGVDHRARRLHRRAGIRRKAFNEAGPQARTVRHRARFRRDVVSRANVGGRFHHEHRHAIGQHRFQPVQQIGMDDDGLRLAIVQDIGGLGRSVVPVDRRDIEAEHAGAQRRLQKREIVAQDQRHRFPRLQPEGGKSGCPAKAPLFDLDTGKRAFPHTNKGLHRLNLPLPFCSGNHGVAHR